MGKPRIRSRIGQIVRKNYDWFTSSWSRVCLCTNPRQISSFYRKTAAKAVSFWNISFGKPDFLSRCSVALGNSSPGTTWKAVFHLLFNRIVRKRFVNAKQTICSICSRVVDSKYKIQSLGDEKTLVELTDLYGLDWVDLHMVCDSTCGFLVRILLFLLQTNYHTLPYPKTSKGKFEPRMTYIFIYMYMLWSSFIPWLKFSFLLFQTGYNILLYPKTYKTA